MAHPDLRIAAQVLEQVGRIVDLQLGGPVFAHVAGGDLASVLQVEELHAVADAKHGHALALEPGEVDVGRVLLLGAARAAGEDDPGGIGDVADLVQLIEARVVAEFADAADDELGVLAAVINDGDLGAHAGGLRNSSS